MVDISKGIYFDALGYIVDTYHRAIKMKPIDVRSDSFAKFNKTFNTRDPKFKIVNHVRI